MTDMVTNKTWTKFFFKGVSRFKAALNSVFAVLINPSWVRVFWKVWLGIEVSLMVGG